MYVDPNFKTKKALKEAVANGQHVTIFQPNNIFNVQVPTDGLVHGIEGPHAPEPHRWYASVEVRNGVVVNVK